MMSLREPTLPSAETDRRFEEVTPGLAVTASEPARNNWQRLSDATGTILTPANMLDAIGAGFAKYGCDHLSSWRGIGAATIGFMTDIADGKIARRTGTTSPLGEKVDAAGDKIKLAYGLKKVSELGLAPPLLMQAIKLQNSANVGLTMIDQITNKAAPVLHASWFGKRAIFLQQCGVGLHVVGSQLKRDGKKREGEKLKTAGTVLGIGGIALGCVATADYGATLVGSFLNRRRR